uniref:NADH-ubiquinone oxidoreductase chain 6 n=1 Tax=Telmatobufo australis TaxID=93483 RepID=A0A0G3F7X1_9NEOB
MYDMLEFGLIIGLLAVASNPSPYYAALGLVGSSGVGCLILAVGGVSFLSLVLFLVYLGGMMVVFGYSSALVAEPYPEAWGSSGVMMYMVFYAMLLSAWWMVSDNGPGKVGVRCELEIVLGDWVGVSVVFYLAGWLLLFAGWSLLLTLFVVLEVVRGHYSGVLRAV